MRGFDKKERRERGSVKREREERTFFSVTSEKPKGEKTQNEESGTKQTKRKMTPPTAILFVSFYRSLEHV